MEIWTGSDTMTAPTGMLMDELPPNVSFWRVSASMVGEPVVVPVTLALVKAAEAAVIPSGVEPYPLEIWTRNLSVGNVR